MSFPARAVVLGRHARAVLEGGAATVFAAFDRSFYVETPRGIACVGGTGLGKGPLNVSVVNDRLQPPGPVPEVGSLVTIDCRSASIWIPESPRRLPGQLPVLDFSLRPAIPFLEWLAAGAGKPSPGAEALIGMGPGLTPAGDDFVGGAMIALRAFGDAEWADRIAAWALPLAEKRTSRISRAHLACAAAGEGHEALHLLLDSLGQKEDFEKSLKVLSRIGHTSGLDAAAGALLALKSRRRPSRRTGRSAGIR